MTPIPIAKIFSVRNILASTVARFGQIIHNNYRSTGHNTIEQVVFYFQDTLVEACTTTCETFNNEINFSILQGFANTRSRANLMEENFFMDMFETFKERICTIYPTFDEKIHQSFTLEKTPEGKVFLRIQFFRK